MAELVRIRLYLFSPKFELFWCAAVEEDSSIVRTILTDFKACFVLHVVVSGCTENPNGFVTPSSGSPF